MTPLYDESIIENATIPEELARAIVRSGTPTGAGIDGHQVYVSPACAQGVYYALPAPEWLIVNYYRPPDLEVLQDPDFAVYCHPATWETYLLNASGA